MFQIVIHAAEGLGRDCLESLLQASGRIDVVAVAATLAELNHAAQGVTPRAVLVVDPPAGGATPPTAPRLAALWPAAEVLRGAYEPAAVPALAPVRPTPDGPRVIQLSADAEAIADAVIGKPDASDTAGPRPAAKSAVLTARETRVLRHLAEGLSARESADRLALKSRTIDSHRRSVSRKLGLASTAQLTRFAIATGLVTAGPDGRPACAVKPDRSTESAAPESDRRAALRSSG